MGIDIYMTWKNQTPDEEKAQLTGFSVTAGATGYLREAYHGGPYVTHWLVQEAFVDYEDDPSPDVPNGIPIAAETLRARLPGAVFLALARHAIVYDEPDPDQPQTLVDAFTSIFADMHELKTQRTEVGILSRVNEEQLNECIKRIRERALPDYALAFVEFVELAERKEKELGEPVRVIASY
jgi:hypothetical protein